MKPNKIQALMAFAGFCSLVLTANQQACSAVFAANIPDKTDKSFNLNAWQAPYDRGIALLDQAKPRAAELEFQKSIKLLQQHKNADALSDAYHKLANCQALDGQTVKAEASYRKSLAVLQAKYGANSIKCAPALVALGCFFESLGDHSCASAFYQKATGLSEKRQGSIDPSITAGYLIQRPGSILRNFDLPAYSSRSKDLSDRASLSSSRSLLESLQKPHPDLLGNSEDADKVLLNDFEKQYGIKN